MIIVYVVIILLLYGALVWEKNDIQKIWKMTPVYKIKDTKKRRDQIRFVNSFMYRNNIMWRSIYITGLISTAIIYFFIRYYASKNELANSTVIFLIIFICFYANNNYRTFHIYRVLGSKIDKSLILLEDIQV